MRKVRKTCSSSSSGGCPTSNRVNVNYVFLTVELWVCTPLTVVTLLMMFLVEGVEPATVAHFCQRGTINSGPVGTCASCLFLARGRVV